jgi:dCTP deaminase
MTSLEDIVKDWLPGALNDSQLKSLHKHCVIRGDTPGEFGESSIDLTLGDHGWHMPKGGIKPSGESYSARVTNAPEYFKPLPSGRDGEFLLKRGNTYLFKVGQSLQAQDIKTFGFHGQATAKSSIGRLDVLVRLIVDGMDCYEGFMPDRITSGDMFVEISPLSFDVLVRKGVSITQLRLFYGSIRSAEIDGPELHKATLIGENQDGYLRVDLSNDKIAEGACAFQARTTKNNKPIALWKGAALIDPKPYWKALKSSNDSQGPSLPIQKGNFYILRSKERLALHDSVAVYCLAIDESIGEMRIHYAGFVHPMFGRQRNDGGKGTPLIFEVRGHDVPVVLRDGEKLAKLKYYRMSQPYKPQRVASSKATPKARSGKASKLKSSKPGDPYQDQTLQLSKFFADWS